MVNQNTTDKNVLIIDDSPQDRQLVRNDLEEAGILPVQIKEASNFEEANSLLHNNQFHLIITDLLIPSPEDIKKFKIHLNPGNAAKMPPRKLHAYLKQTYKFIQELKKDPSVWVITMTFFWDSTAVINYRYILDYLGVDILPKYFNGSDEAKSRGKRAMGHISAAVQGRVSNNELLRSYISTCNENISLIMERDNFLSQLAVHGKEDEFNSLRLVVAPPKFLLVLLLRPKEDVDPEAYKYACYCDWNFLRDMVLLNESVDRTLYLSVDSHLYHLPRFNIRSSEGLRISEVRERIIGYRELRDVKTKVYEDLFEELKKNLRHQLLLACLALQTKPPVGQGGQCLKMREIELPDYFHYAENVIDRTPFGLPAEDWSNFFRRITRNEMGGLRDKWEDQLVDAFRNVTNVHQRNFLFALQTKIIPREPGRGGGYHFNGTLKVITYDEIDMLSDSRIQKGDEIFFNPEADLHRLSASR